MQFILHFAINSCCVAKRIAYFLGMPKINQLKNVKPFQVRQGDVLIERVAQFPKTIVPRAVPEAEQGRVILAYGEVTGHAHEIESPKLATMWEVKDALRSLGPDYALEVAEETAVIHQEHGRIPLPAGKFIVRRQREYSPEALRNVAD